MTAPGTEIVESVQTSAMETLHKFVKEKISSSAKPSSETRATSSIRKEKVQKNKVTGRVECSWKVTQHYLINDVNIDLEKVFDTMQHAARGVGVYAWSIEEPSLDDVFVTIAGNYMDED